MALRTSLSVSSALPRALACRLHGATDRLVHRLVESLTKPRTPVGAFADSRRALNTCCMARRAHGFHHFLTAAVAAAWSRLRGSLVLRDHDDGERRRHRDQRTRPSRHDALYPLLRGENLFHRGFELVIGRIDFGMALASFSFATKVASAAVSALYLPQYPSATAPFFLIDSWHARQPFAFSISALERRYRQRTRNRHQQYRHSSGFPFRLDTICGSTLCRLVTVFLFT